MPYTIANLISLKNLSEADVKATLEAADLSLEGEHSEEDIRNSFDVIRGFIDSGQASNYEEAKQLFIALSAKNGKARSSKNSTEPSKKQKNQRNIINNTPSNNNLTGVGAIGTGANEANLSILDLIAYVKEHLGLTLTLKQAVAILDTSGLSDKPLYTQQEGNKFLIACSILIKNDGGNIGDRIQDVTLALETGLISLVNQVTSTRAKEVPDLVKQLYLQNVVMSLAEQQEDIEAFFMQIKEGIIKGIEGKSPLRSILEVDWIQTPLPELGNLPDQLPPTSENTTNTDLTNELKPNDTP